MFQRLKCWFGKHYTDDWSYEYDPTTNIFYKVSECWYCEKELYRPSNETEYIEYWTDGFEITPEDILW